VDYTIDMRESEFSEGTRGPISIMVELSQGRCRFGALQDARRKTLIQAVPDDFDRLPRDP
jgi:hypothetical protein